MTRPLAPTQVAALNRAGDGLDRCPCGAIAKIAIVFPPSAAKSVRPMGACRACLRVIEVVDDSGSPRIERVSELEMVPADVAGLAAQLEAERAALPRAN